MFDYLIVGAGFAGSVLAERLASASGKKVLIVRPARRTSAATPTTTTTTTGILVHKYGPHIFHTNSQRGLRLPVAVHRVAAVRAPRARAGRRAARADPDQPRHDQPALRARASRRSSSRTSSPSRRRAARVGPHLRGRRRQQGRARALREVLPQLHAQAVGARPVGARRQRDRARARAHQPRRPLLHRHLPGDAAARLHADVRAHARPPATSR